MLLSALYIQLLMQQNPFSYDLNGVYVYAGMYVRVCIEVRMYIPVRTCVNSCNSCIILFAATKA